MGWAAILTPVLWWILCTTASGDGNCPGKWLGPNCDVLCYCENRAEGCEPCEECKYGYMGYKCTIKNAAIDHMTALTDRHSANLCLQETNRLSRKFYTYEPIHFEYAEFNKFSEEDAEFFLLDSRRNSFRPPGGWKRIIIDPLTAADGDHRTIVYADNIDQVITGIEIHFSNSLAASTYCDMRIAAGSNVALKKTTSMTSVLSEAHASNNAVDGDDLTCAKSKLEDDPAITVNLTYPTKINWFTFNNTANPKDLFYFSVKTYDDEGVFLGELNYSDTFELHSVDLKSDGTNHSVSAVSFVRRKVTDEGLDLCEFKVTGNSVCPPGFFGPNCFAKCSHGCLDEDCLTSGHCRKGCKDTYVLDQGHCEACKEPYSLPLCLCDEGIGGVDCTEECENGTWGRSCLETCSIGCPTTCEIKFGMCPMCLPGFHGYKCEIKGCPDGYYGSNCTMKCSDDCNKKLGNLTSYCDPRTGECSFGRRPRSAKSNKLTKDWWWLGLAGLLLLLLLALCLLCLMRKRKKPPEDAMAAQPAPPAEEQVPEGGKAEEEPSSAQGTPTPKSTPKSISKSSREASENEDTPVDTEPEPEEDTANYSRYS